MAASGTSHTLFLSESGLVRAVGANASGQLGDGTTTPSASGVFASGLANVVMIAAGGSHSLALKGDGTVWSWGRNDAGQLGLGDTGQRNAPVQIGALAAIVAIAAGDQHSLALASDGRVYAWGLNSSLQTGGPCGSVGTNVLAPQLVYANVSSTMPCVPGAALAGVTSIAAGAAFNVALRSDGTVWTWGDNAFGQLGNGTTGTDSALPVAVSGITTATRIAAGGEHALALLRGDATLDTRVKSWGRNDSGQLGDNNAPSDSNIPVFVSIPTSIPPFAVPTKAVALVAAGAKHSLIVYQTGPAASFGEGGSGQLGTGTTSDIDVVVEFGTYLDAAGVFAGPMANRTFVYRPGDGAFGRFESTGSNAAGELGQGFAGADVLAPAPVTVVTGVGDKIGKRTNFRIDASRSDLFWRNGGTNVTWDYTGSGPTAFSAAVLPGLGTNWQGLATADVSGDGRSDVVWLEPSTGNTAIWIMAGPSALASVVFPPSLGVGSPWVFSGAGDFDGDGRSDLLWRHNATGEVVVWYFGVGGNFEQVVSIGTVSIASGWQIEVVADVNGDWVDDIVWFRPSDGQVAIWRLAPTGAFQGLFPAAVGPGSAWRIFEAGDFDGDGRVDLFWRNTSDGTNAVWFFRGGNVVDAPQFYVGTPLAQWRIDATGDFDGDGRDDLMWTDVNTGVTVRWLMGPRGSTPTAQTVIGIGTGWEAVQ